MVFKVKHYSKHYFPRCRFCEKNTVKMGRKRRKGRRKWKIRREKDYTMTSRGWTKAALNYGSEKAWHVHSKEEEVAFLNVVTMHIRTRLCITFNTHHAFVTLDHKAFILVEATDTSDDIIVLFMPVLLFRDGGLTAVRLTCCFSHNLINLRWCLMPGTVIGLS